MTLALFETLVDLNCEDVMLELCLGALAPCSHVMLSQRRRLLRDLDPFGRCAEKFLSLGPNCCATVSPSILMAAAALTAVSPSASPNPLRQAVPNAASTAAIPPSQVNYKLYKDLGNLLNTVWIWILIIFDLLLNNSSKRPFIKTRNFRQR